MLTALLLLWVNLAVGIIGSEDNPANSGYIAVYIVGLLGAAMCRLRPRGMAVTLAGMALVQSAITILAVMHVADGSWVPAIEVTVLNCIFVVLWLISAWLFALAARRYPVRY